MFSFQLTDDPSNREAYYLQSQNGNIWSADLDEEPELSKFQPYVDRGPKIMRDMGKWCFMVNVFSRLLIHVVLRNYPYRADTGRYEHMGGHEQEHNDAA